MAIRSGPEALGVGQNSPSKSSHLAPGSLLIGKTHGGIMSVSESPLSNSWRYQASGPIGHRFTKLTELMAENGMTLKDGYKSRDERMLGKIAYSFAEALRRLETFTSPDKWAIERLVSIKETYNGPIQVLRRPKLDMSICYTAKEGLCVEWCPRWEESNRAQFGDFRLHEYDMRKQPFQRPFFETFYLSGFGEYVDGIADSPDPQRMIRSEIARLAIDCATEIMNIASRTCDVRLDGRLKEVLVPGTEIIKTFHYEDLESIEMEKRADQARREAQRKAEALLEIDEFEKWAGVNAKWFCDNVERLRNDGVTFDQIARSLNELGGQTEFSRGSVMSSYRDISRKLDIMSPDWRFTDIGRPHLVVKEKPRPAPSKERTSSSNFMLNVSRRISEHQEKTSKAKPEDALAPDYSNLTRYRKADGVLAELGLGSVDELVSRINEFRAGSGRRPIPQGSFPSNKVLFEKLVQEFTAQNDGRRLGL